MLRILLTAALLALPRPAFAVEAAQSAPPEATYRLPNPWHAAQDGVIIEREAAAEHQGHWDAAPTLSLATMPLIVMATLAANVALGTPYLATQTKFYAIPPEVNGALMVASPLGLSAGYLYAGEPLRGALVGLGGVAITAAGFGLPALYRGQESINLFFGVTGPLMLAGLIGYNWWVYNDLNSLIIRKRHESATVSETSNL